MRPNYPQHLKAFDYLGLHRYHLRFCTDARQPFFEERSSVELVLEQISRAAIENRFAVPAYCFMPDHLHLVVEGEADNSDCLVFIRKAKQYSGFYFSKARGRKLWQRYGYESVVRDESIAQDVIRYVLHNPVRAGIVSDVRDYPFAGSLKYPLDAILERLTDPGSA